MLTKNFRILPIGQKKIEYSKKTISTDFLLERGIAELCIFANSFPVGVSLGVYRISTWEDIAKIWRNPLLKITQTSQRTPGK